MDNPYAHLVIYNFDGLPDLPSHLDNDPRFLGCWEEDGTSFVFFNSRADDLMDALCKAHPTIPLTGVYEMTGEEWHGDEILPYSVGNLLISPPWDILPGRKQILLDPGVVFGTGRHPTTESCLDLIQYICEKDGISRAMDIGTGTGLLALGAAALGVPSVLACDFNFLAVQTCRRNILLNDMEEQILAFQARGEDIMEIPCDLLVANIHYDVMKDLILHPALGRVKWILLSGILNSQTRQVMADLKAANIHVLQRRCPDGIWNTLLARPAFFLD